MHCKFGFFLMEGILEQHQNESSNKQGAIYITMAAGQGSDISALVIGLYFADGSFGFPLDRSQAVFWLRKGLGCDCLYQHSTEVARRKAQAKLAELLASTEDDMENGTISVP